MPLIYAYILGLLSVIAKQFPMSKSGSLMQLLQYVFTIDTV